MGRKRKTRRSIAWLLLLGILVLAIATILPVLSLRWIPPLTTSFMIQKRLAAWKNGQPGYRLRYRWVAWKDISPHLPIAVVAAEDQKFPQHAGFDLESIGDAWHDQRNGKRPRGASTITQQVAKNLFLWPGRSFLRKGLEAYFTVLIELVWPKRRILEVYLNIAELGNGIFGVAAAGDAFWGKKPSRIGREEAALLAAVLPNPLRLHAERPSEYVLKRRDWILQQIHRLGGAAYLRNL